MSVRTINTWKARHVDFLQALKAGKTEADDRVERALYHRPVGYSHEVEKRLCCTDEGSGRSDPRSNQG